MIIHFSIFYKYSSFKIASWISLTVSKLFLMPGYGLEAKQVVFVFNHVVL